MSKTCGHNVPCGCGDKALTTPPNCNTTGDCAGETCAEIFCQECISYCQEDMEAIISGNTLSIEKGARLDQVIQKLFVFLNDPACAELAAIGLRAKAITKDKISIVWSGDAALNYVVTWVEGINVNTDTVNGIFSYDINNLIPDTEYSVYITTLNTTCNSVTLKIKTKPA